MQNILVKLRDAIEDNYKYTTDSFEYLTSKIFTLTECNVDITTLVCYKNGSLYAASNYSYSATTGKVTVTGALVAGDVLEFVYNAYAKYSDNELRGYIRSALAYLSIEKYGTFVAKSDNTIYPTATEAEGYLIAAIAAIIIKGGIRSYKTPEITITFNETQSKEDKIKSTIRQFSKVFGVVDYIELDAKEVADDENED